VKVGSHHPFHKVQTNPSLGTADCGMPRLALRSELVSPNAYIQKTCSSLLIGFFTATGRSPGESNEATAITHQSAPAPDSEAHREQIDHPFQCDPGHNFQAVLAGCIVATENSLWDESND